MLALIAMLVMPWLAQAQQAQIRAIHLAPGAPDVDVYIASDTASFYGLGYGSASSVSSLAPGSVRVRISEHNIPTPLFFDQNVTLEANRRRILLIMGTTGNIQTEMITLPTNAATVPADSATMRFVNASPDAGNVDIRIRDSYGNVSNFAGVAFKANTVFRSIPRGMADIEVYAAGTSNLMLKVRNDFGSSTRSTIFVSGLAVSQMGLKLQMLNEMSLSAQQPIRSLQAPSPRLRAVHLVPDAPAIDIYTGTSLAISNLANGDASDLVAVPGGTYNLGVTATGAPISTSLFSVQVNTSEDSVYTATAMGMLATPPSVLVLARPALMSVSTDSVLVRMVNAVPDTGKFDVTLENGGEPVTLAAMMYKGATPYMKIPKGDITVRLRGDGIAPYDAVGTLEGGSMMTLYVTGDGIYGLNDNLSSEQKPMMKLTRLAGGGLRAVHVVPDAPGVDIFLNNDATNPVSLTFRQASPIAELSAGMANVKVAATGTGIGAALITRDVQISSDTLITAFAVGSLALGSADVVTLPTGLEDAPPQGAVSVRILHASPDAGTIDAEFIPSMGGPAQMTGMAFKMYTPYLLSPPGPGTLTLFAAGSSTPILTVQGTLTEGDIVTAIITGSVTQGNLGVNLLIDSRDEEQKPMILLAPPASSVDADRAVAGFSIAPNPTRGPAQITYSLKNAASVRLSLYSQSGELVAISDLGSQEAGSYTTSLSTAVLPAGVYNAVLTGKDGSAIGTQKMVVVK